MKENTEKQHEEVTVSGAKETVKEVKNAPHDESKSKIEKKIEIKTQSDSKIQEIVPIDPANPEGAKTFNLIYKKFNNGITRQLKQLVNSRFKDFNYDPESSPFEQFISYVNEIKGSIDALTNEELDFLYEMAKYLEHSHKESKETYEYFYKPIVVLFVLNEVDQKFRKMEVLFKEMMKVIIFQVTNNCVENVDNAVIRGQRLRHIQKSDEISDEVFFEHFQEVFYPELKYVKDFYMWMVYGDESMTVSEETLEEINEFLDKAYEYYLNKVNSVQLEEETFECESFIINQSQFEEFELSNKLRKLEEINQANTEIKDHFRMNQEAMLREIQRIQDQDANGNLDEDEMRICVTEFFQCVQMNMDKVVDHLQTFIRIGVSSKIRVMQENILRAQIKDDGSDFTVEDILSGQGGIKDGIPKIRSVDYLTKECETLHQIDRFDKILEIVFGFVEKEG